MIIFEHTVPTLMIWMGLLAAVAVGAYSAWRFAPRMRAILIIGGLHLLFLLILAWCLLLPGSRKVETHTLKPRFVVALDTSGSMLLSPSDNISNRWSIARDILELPWTRSVAAECEIDVYAFNSEVASKIPLAEAIELTPDGKATLLRDALQKITGRYAGMNVAGGLVLSDGLDTREAFDEWAAEARPFRLYTARLEPDSVWEIEPDIRVDAVHTPRRVTVDWQSELKAVISGQGTKGRAVNVQLYKDGTLQQETPTQIPDDGGSRQVNFALTHDEIGVFTYRVVAPPVPGESNTNDNEYAVSVQVIDAKNRLIYVEGPPRWESKYLKRALQANEQVTPLIFVQGPGGKPLSFGPVGSMTADLTDQQLAFFKIVVLGNLDAEEIGEQRARNLVQFVETGGSLVLLGGTKAWSKQGFPATSLKKILPVKSYGGKTEEGEFPVSLTDEGRTHQAFAGDPELWDIIPPVLSVFPRAVPSRAARALVSVQTPTGEHPIILTQRYGQGKVVAVFTDSLWKWKLHPDAIDTRPYQRFWDQLISWMLPEEDELAKDKLELFADKETVVLGEEIKVSARLGGDEQEGNVTVRCKVELPDGSKAPFSMRPEVVTTASGKVYPGFVMNYEAILPGLHTVTATATVGGNPLNSDPISFFVKPFSPESVPRAVNNEVLKTLARTSGGRFFEDQESLNDALSSLRFAQIEDEVSTYRSLWQLPWVIACLIAVATITWIVRKMNNMP
jgi:hypothetical protein